MPRAIFAVNPQTGYVECKTLGDTTKRTVGLLPDFLSPIAEYGGAQRSGGSQPAFFTWRGRLWVMYYTIVNNVARFRYVEIKDFNIQPTLHLDSMIDVDIAKFTDISSFIQAKKYVFSNTHENQDRIVRIGWPEAPAPASPVVFLFGDYGSGPDVRILVGPNKIYGTSASWTNWSTNTTNFPSLGIADPHAGGVLFSHDEYLTWAPVGFAGTRTAKALERILQFQLHDHFCRVRRYYAYQGTAMGNMPEWRSTTPAPGAILSAIRSPALVYASLAAGSIKGQLVSVNPNGTIDVIDDIRFTRRRLLDVRDYPEFVIHESPIYPQDFPSNPPPLAPAQARFSPGGVLSPGSSGSAIDVAGGRLDIVEGFRRGERADIVGCYRVPNTGNTPVESLLELKLIGTLEGSPILGLTKSDGCIIRKGYGGNIYFETALQEPPLQPPLVDLQFAGSPASARCITVGDFLYIIVGGRNSVTTTAQKTPPFIILRWDGRYPALFSRRVISAAWNVLSFEPLVDELTQTLMLVVHTADGVFECEIDLEAFAIRSINPVQTLSLAEASNAPAIVSPGSVLLTNTVETNIEFPVLPEFSHTTGETILRPRLWGGAGRCAELLIEYDTGEGWKKATLKNTPNPLPGLVLSGDGDQLEIAHESYKDIEDLVCRIRYRATLKVFGVPGEVVDTAFCDTERIFVVGKSRHIVCRGMFWFDNLGGRVFYQQNERYIELPDMYPTKEILAEEANSSSSSISGDCIARSGFLTVYGNSLYAIFQDLPVHRRFRVMRYQFETGRWIDETQQIDWTRVRQLFVPDPVAIDRKTVCVNASNDAHVPLPLDGNVLELSDGVVAVKVPNIRNPRVRVSFSIAFSTQAAGSIVVGLSPTPTITPGQAAIRVYSDYSTTPTDVMVLREFSFAPGTSGTVDFTDSATAARSLNEQWASLTRDHAWLVFRASNLSGQKVRVSDIIAAPATFLGVGTFVCSTPVNYRGALLWAAAATHTPHAYVFALKGRTVYGAKIPHVYGSALGEITHVSNINETAAVGELTVFKDRLCLVNKAMGSREMYDASQPAMNGSTIRDVAAEIDFDGQRIAFRHIYAVPKVCNTSTRIEEVSNRGSADAWIGIDRRCLSGVWHRGALFRVNVLGQVVRLDEKTGLFDVVFDIPYMLPELFAGTTTTTGSVAPNDACDFIAARVPHPDGLPEHHSGWGALAVGYWDAFARLRISSVPGVPALSGRRGLYVGFDPTDTTKHFAVLEHGRRAWTVTVSGQSYARQLLPAGSVIECRYAFAGSLLGFVTGENPVIVSMHEYQDDIVIAWLFSRMTMPGPNNQWWPKRADNAPFFASLAFPPSMVLRLRYHPDTRSCTLVKKTRIQVDRAGVPIDVNAITGAWEFDPVAGLATLVYNEPLNEYESVVRTLQIDVDAGTLARDGGSIAAHSLAKMSRTTSWKYVRDSRPPIAPGGVLTWHLNSPSAFITSVEQDVKSSRIYVRYRLYSPDSRPLHIKARFSIVRDDGTTTEFRNATPADPSSVLFLGSSPEGVEHVFVHDVTSDEVAQKGSVQYEIVPFDTSNTEEACRDLECELWVQGMVYGCDHAPDAISVDNIPLAQVSLGSTRDCRFCQSMAVLTRGAVKVKTGPFYVLKQSVLSLANVKIDGQIPQCEWSTTQDAINFSRATMWIAPKGADSDGTRVYICAATAYPGQTVGFPDDCTSFSALKKNAKLIGSSGKYPKLVPSVPSAYPSDVTPFEIQARSELRNNRTLVDRCLYIHPSTTERMLMRSIVVAPLAVSAVGNVKLSISQWNLVSRPMQNSISDGWFACLISMSGSWGSLRFKNDDGQECVLIQNDGNENPVLRSADNSGGNVWIPIQGKKLTSTRLLVLHVENAAVVSAYIDPPPGFAPPPSPDAVASQFGRPVQFKTIEFQPANTGQLDEIRFAPTYAGLWIDPEAYDYFQYNVGDTTLNGGVGWSHPWSYSGPPPIVSGGLQFPGSGIIESNPMVHFAVLSASFQELGSAYLAIEGAAGKTDLHEPPRVYTNNTNLISIRSVVPTEIGGYRSGVEVIYEIKNPENGRYVIVRSNNALHNNAREPRIMTVAQSINDREDDVVVFRGTPYRMQLARAGVAHIAEAVLPQPRLGEPYIGQIVVGNPGRAHVVEAENLPQGLVLSGTAITGTPSDVQQNFVTTIRVRDLFENKEDTIVRYWRATPASFEAAPLIVTTPIGAVIGMPMTYPIPSSLIPQSATIRAVLGLPAGLTFNASNRTISGTPSESGTRFVSVAWQTVEAGTNTTYNRTTIIRLDVTPFITESSNGPRFRFIQQDAYLELPKATKDVPYSADIVVNTTSGSGWSVNWSWISYLYAPMEDSLYKSPRSPLPAGISAMTDPASKRLTISGTPMETGAFIFMTVFQVNRSGSMVEAIRAPTLLYVE